MTTGGLIIVFAALMGVVAMLAIGVDWLGKPIRNRKFRPRIYRYADEENLTPIDPTATHHSDDRFLLPAPTAPELPQYNSAGGSDWAAAAFELPESSDDPWERLGAEMNEPARGLGGLGDTDESLLPSTRQFDTGATTQATRPVSPVGPTGGQVSFQSLISGVATAPPEPGEWSPGDPIWSRMRSGATPSGEIAGRRFWQSAAAFIPGIQWYGPGNVERLLGGNAPERRNRRTGQIETMDLAGLDSPGSAMSLRPHWPEEQIDPFQP